MGAKCSLPAVYDEVTCKNFIKPDPVYDANTCKAFIKDPVYDKNTCKDFVRPDPVYDANSCKAFIKPDPVYDEKTCKAFIKKPQVCNANSCKAFIKDPVYDAKTCKAFIKEPVYDANSCKAFIKDPVYDANTCKAFINKSSSNNLRLGLNYKPVNEDSKVILEQLQVVLNSFQPVACTKLSQRIVDTIANTPFKFENKSNFGAIPMGNPMANMAANKIREAQLNAAKAAENKRKAENEAKAKTLAARIAEAKAIADKRIADQNMANKAAQARANASAAAAKKADAAKVTASKEVDKANVAVLKTTNVTKEVVGTIAKVSSSSSGSSDKVSATTKVMDNVRELPFELQDANFVKSKLMNEIKSKVDTNDDKVIKSINDLINICVNRSTVKGKVDVNSVKNQLINIIKSMCPNVKKPKFSKSGFGGEVGSFFSGFFITLLLIIIGLIIVIIMYRKGKLPWLKELLCGKPSIASFGRRRYR
jgi:hypothetical protein